MKPTLGRIVLVCLFAAIVPAIVTAVHSDTAIGVTAFPYSGLPVALPTVVYQQPEAGQSPGEKTWHWMDYQIVQAAKADAVAKAAREAAEGLAGPSLAESAGLRRVYGHESNPANSKIIIVADRPGPGGASHEYRVRIGATSEVSEAADVQMVRFQNGPVNEDGNGVNGTTHEVLLTIVADRLKGFQDGPYACDENAEALMSVENALSLLHRRTLVREARGVAGTHKV